VSSTTVNLVLTVRKAVSLGLSVWYYGTGVTPGLAIGGGMVLGECGAKAAGQNGASLMTAGTVLYSLAPAPARAEGQIKKHDSEPTPAASADASVRRDTGKGLRRRAPVTGKT
jgi:UDP-xylose/UDP-N-acetylglucosamine transporter B4